MTNQERYVFNRDEYSDKDQILWDDWAGDMDIDVPQEEDKLEWIAYVQRRNSTRMSINRMAQSRKANWRLVSFDRGKSIRKLRNVSLIKNEVPERAKRIGQHLSSARKETELFSEIEKLSAANKKYCKEIGAVLLGAAMFISGNIAKMSIDTETKQQLLNLLDLKADDSPE